jgi:DNA-damage-inducible protein J
MDKDDKERAKKLFSEFGLDMTTAINMFLKQSIRENAIPFLLTLDVPNETTRRAMAEGDGIIASGRGRFSSAQEIFDSIGV